MHQLFLFVAEGGGGPQPVDTVNQAPRLSCVIDGSGFF